MKPAFSRASRGLVALALAAASTACTTPASNTIETPHWSVWIFHPFRPGVLGLCEDAHLKPDFERLAKPDPADPGKSRVLADAFSVRWQGGSFSQQAAAGALAGPPLPRMDACFALIVDGRPVLSGAAVPSQSARLLRFPTLMQVPSPPGAPLRFELLPRYPSELAAPVPPDWASLLPG